MPISPEEVMAFLNSEKCYFLSRHDSGFYDTDKCISEHWSEGSPFMIVTPSCERAYLETEYNFSEHRSYLLS